MAQVTDYTVSNQTFPNTRADLNNIFAAIATNNSGTSAPSNQQAGQWWIDTTSSTWVLYIHDGTDDIQFATIDTSANTVNFTDSALDVVTDTTPQLGGNLDLNSNDITGTGNINITGTATVTGLTTTGDINFGDNDKAQFGASNDLQIYHDGTHSYISDQGTGNLRLLAANFAVSNPAGNENYIIAYENGAVEISYDDVVKLATTSSGVTVTGTVSTTDSVSSTNGITFVGNSGTPSAGAFLHRPSANTLVLGTASTERMRIDSSGRVGIGETSMDGLLVVKGNSDSSSTPSIRLKDGTDAREAFITNESGDLIIATTNSSDDVIDSAIKIYTAQMIFTVDGSEAMRIDSSGNVLIGGSDSSYVSGGGIQLNGSSGDELWGTRHTSTTAGVDLANWQTGIAGGGLTSTGNFLKLADGGNTRFKFKGDGNATCDGSFSGGGADYAEYFEWTDGNSSNEDRVGLSVVLDNGKIREATASDTNIIGVVSANPTVIGDEQPHHWQDKFVTDDFGRVQYETLTTWKWEIDGTTDGYIEGRTDKDIPENATNVESFEHPYEMINPNYDETLEYTPRSERQEWSCVGLMGKLRIKKGQQTDSNWIKIRDISDTVEEWLIK